MTCKEVVRQVLDTVPDEASMDDIMYALYVRAKFERSLRHAREGKTVSQEEAKRRSAQWRQ